MFNPAKIFVSFLALASVTDAKPSALRQSSSNEDEKKSHLIESFDLVALTLRSAPLIDETQVDPSFYPVGKGTCVDANGAGYMQMKMGTIKDAKQCGTTCIAKEKDYPLVGIQMNPKSLYCSCVVENVQVATKERQGLGVVAGAEVLKSTDTRICYRYDGYVSPSCKTNIEGVKKRNEVLVQDMDVKKKEVDKGTQVIQDTKKEVKGLVQVIQDTKKEVVEGTKAIKALVKKANTCQVNDGAVKSQ